MQEMRNGQIFVGILDGKASIWETVRRIILRCALKKLSLKM
jgi:hypothetical protein